MDRLTAMHVFVRVAESGSFTRTADQLDLPRATVSTAIQQLEASLGARLLHRTTRRVHLTQDGAALLERCRSILADMDEVDNMFRQTASRLSGKLKVDVPSRFGRRLLAPALPALFERHPDLELELGVTDRAIDLIQEGVDCVVRVGNPGNSSLVARPLGEFAMINCASPAYLAQHGLPASPADLDHHWAIQYASPSTGRVAPWEYQQQGGLQVRAVRGRITVNNAETYIACCLAGLGLIQVPAYDVQDHLANGELIAVMNDATAAPMPVYALYPHRRHLSQRVQIFIDWLASLLLTPLR
ncbi:LysR family transcriptional regulator [Chitinivorax sp. B]|uniref:LysR family transcriptional regulator n=1 Tax=Chitinivorax sp. B TaxID=2502235 RepID=UPI0010F89C72|nr:LysR family transcriptional regulator [Chitinivorax sp. B]